jgi:hypothetical protein
MSAQLGVAAPAAGLALGVAAVALWVSALPLRWLDALVALLLVAGVALAVAGLLRGASVRARRLAVVALGWNGLGLLTLAILYTAG